MEDEGWRSSTRLDLDDGSSRSAYTASVPVRASLVVQSDIGCEGLACDGGGDEGGGGDGDVEGTTDDGDDGE